MKVLTLLSYILVILASLFVIFPYYWLFVSSLKPVDKLLSYPPDFLPFLSLHNYIEVFSRTKITTFLFNSIFVALSVVLIVILLTLFGGYSLARLNFPGKRFLLTSILFVYLIPPILIVVPLYQLMVILRLIDTYIGIILTHIAHALPFSLWITTVFLEALPKEIEEAASIDGAGKLNILFRIITPISLPLIATVAIFSFIDSWNDFIFASVLLTSDSLKTLPIGVYVFSLGAVIEWGWILSSGVIITLPVLIFFLIFQRYLIKGLTAGAIRG